ncbi:MAG: M24 family metallopeptidase [Sphingomonadaceae bacterium]|nr:M24 family metallopeptidase [Sphingomonadaceae bacterium]
MSEATERLFSYGTLRDPSVQRALFGRELEGRADALPGWRVEPIAIRDSGVVSLSGMSVHQAAVPGGPRCRIEGAALLLTPAELAAADAYETADYERVRVTLASGAGSWLYRRAPVADPALAELIAAEDRALALLSAIERDALVQPGRLETEVERDIAALAAGEFGVTDHWHDRIVRSGPNTLLTAGEPGADRRIGSDDIVFLDLGPVFGASEADVGRSYAFGPDLEKHRLVADLKRVFEAGRARWLADAGITGAGLYAVAEAEAQARGWRFGGTIAGHVVGPFPYARSPAARATGRIGPANHTPMRDPDSDGRARYWILEVHLVEPGGRWGGFYERLLRPER